MELETFEKVLAWAVVALGGGGAGVLAARRGLSRTRDVETDENTKRDFIATIMADGKEARERTEELNSELQTKIEENGQLSGKVQYLEGRVKDLEHELGELRLERHGLANRVQVLESRLNRLLRKHGTETDFGGEL